MQACPSGDKIPQVRQVSITYPFWRRIALSAALAGGTSCLAFAAQAPRNLQAGAQSAQMQANSQNGIRSAEGQLEIRNVQQQLQSGGFYQGNADGIDGPATRAAVRAYQHASKLKVNGLLDRETLQRLGVGNIGQANRIAPAGSNAASSIGSRHPIDGQDFNAEDMNENSASTVRAVQRQLQQQGMYSGAIDGVMSAKTNSALRKYQRQNGLPVSGRLDAQTLTSLGIQQQ